MIQKKTISELPPAVTISGLATIGVNAQGKSVRVPMALLKGKDALQPVLSARLDERGHLIVEVEYQSK